jgi:hypothetical protein
MLEQITSLSLSKIRLDAYQQAERVYGIWGKSVGIKKNPNGIYENTGW